MKIRNVTLPLNPSRKWSEKQVKEFAKRTLESIGPAWDWLTPRVRQALVSEAALSVVRGSARELVSVVAIDILVEDLLTLLPPEG